MKKLLIVLLAAAMLFQVGCTKLPKTNEYVIKDAKLNAEKTDRATDLVFYEIFVGSFSDSDGDGVGDLRGIINRMDYLNDGKPNSGLSLGVEGLWLSPIFQSPSYHKYDVTDYYTVDPAFGTEKDLKELLDLCHERGVKVILDLVINHTGRQNEWFKLFREAHQQGQTGSEYYNFYTWYDSNTESAPAGRAFSQLLGTDHFYECNFSGDMPELNFDNELVRSKVLEVAEHYIDLGVDGFRFDAAKYVYFGDHQRSLEFWNWYLAKLREKKSDIYTVAEVWDGDGITDIYFPATDCFDFFTSQANGLIAETAKKGDANRYTAYVEAYEKRVGAMREGASYTPFITNHDMDRAAGFLTVASGHMQMAANLYILGPGTPFIYYGEELGMRGSRGGDNTDANRRLAMLWGDEDTVQDPKGSTYTAKNQIETTAADQIQDENSLYTYYKKLIMLRKANPEIACGDYTAVKVSGKVGGFKSELNGSTVWVFHNTTISSVDIDLAALGINASELRGFIGMEDAKLEGGVLTIGAQTSVVIK
ncbi:MAG: hypothetical protein IJM85_04270 [Clostridia bacterium]|nr:hypothetical protein [Clostridia bacterium]